QRSLALAVRLAGHVVVSDVVGEPPVLLLDDVFSELDETRAANLVGHLPIAQALVTTAGRCPRGYRPAGSCGSPGAGSGRARRWRRESRARVGVSGAEPGAGVAPAPAARRGAVGGGGRAPARQSRRRRGRDGRLAGGGGGGGGGPRAAPPPPR